MGEEGNRRARGGFCRRRRGNPVREKRSKFRKVKGREAKWNGPLGNSHSSVIKY